MKNLKIKDTAHKRLSDGAKNEGYHLHQFTDAIIRVALNMYDAGEIVLQPIQATVVRPNEGDAEPAA